MSREPRAPSPLFLPGVALLPENFADRLTVLKEITGLSWDGMAVCLGVDIKQLLRWRHGGTPNGGAMLSLVRLATRVPEGLGDLLDDEDLIVIRGRRS